MIQQIVHNTTSFFIIIIIFPRHGINIQYSNDFSINQAARVYEQMNIDTFSPLDILCSIIIIILLKFQFLEKNIK